VSVGGHPKWFGAEVSPPGAKLNALDLGSRWALCRGGTPEQVVWTGRSGDWGQREGRLDPAGAEEEGSNFRGGALEAKAGTCQLVGWAG